MESPTPAQVRKKRGKLTQAKAAALIYKGYRAWQEWESGKNPMDPAFWDLFQRKLKEMRK